MTTELAIDVVSDFVCPWCLIGATRLEQALAALPEIDATVTYHPFLLAPELPIEGVDLRAHLRAKYGADPETMFARVESAAKESGIPLDFAKVTRFASTVPAHTLTRHALRSGTQRALARAIFEAYFLASQDIGDPDVLAVIAAEHGLTRDRARSLATDETEHAATRALAEASRRRGITGVPFFVLGGKLAISGAQPVETMKRAIERASASPAG
jgi:predicted DsbA family dithiol-disulfide isomerase